MLSYSFDFSDILKDYVEFYEIQAVTYKGDDKTDVLIIYLMWFSALSFIIFSIGIICIKRNFMKFNCVLVNICFIGFSGCMLFPSFPLVTKLLGYVYVASLMILWLRMFTRLERKMWGPSSYCIKRSKIVILVIFLYLVCFWNFQGSAIYQIKDSYVHQYDYKFEYTEEYK